jgi:Na+/citrate or Na+/malate symporter
MIGLPAPVGMLFAAVAVKLAHGVSPRIQEGSQVVYKFFRTAVTYPILFAVGVAITPWQELVNAFTFQNLVVIVSTVSALVATGFFVGKKLACTRSMWRLSPAARVGRGALAMLPSSPLATVCR